MKINGLLVGVVAAALLVAGPARAADAPPLLPPSMPTTAPAPLSQGFDWSGIFVGSFGSANVETGNGLSWGNIGAQAGFNLVRNRLFVGATVQAGGYFYWTGFGGSLVQANARFGLATGRALLYGLVGMGIYPPGSPHFDFGAGVEIALGRRISAFSEVRYEYFVGFPAPPHYLRFEFGLNFHLGN